MLAERNGDPDLDLRARASRRLAALAETLGIDTTFALAQPDATLRPGELEQRALTRIGEWPPAVAEVSLASLPPVGLAPPDDIVVGELLGRGGMGVVLEARQVSLDRAVAVKQPLTDAGARALVEEARIMARVEHPNVVPVHALTLTPTGQPALVMKRIQGASLKDLCDNRDHATWLMLESRWGDREAALLGVLSEVCDALARAHAAGVVHRDVKPENVMLGQFGEVFLLDWGIACRVGERGPPGAIVGTPGFMAPEMVLDEGLFDERTDVYLLGSTLHTLLTGTLRHSADSFFGTLALALMSEPIDYGPDIAADLAALANAATHVDKEARPASAAAFRRALADHERHREAMGLLRGAREAIRSAGESGPGSAEAGRLLAEAGLSLGAARRALPGSDAVASIGHQHLVALVERDLALESPQAARAHLMLVEPSDAALEARVVALERKLSSARESEQVLQMARANADTQGSFRPRLALSLVAGGLFAALVVLRGTYLPSVNQARSILENDLIVLAFLGAGAAIWRKTFLANAGNRQLTALTVGQVVSFTLANAAVYVLETPRHQGVVYTYIVVAVWWASAAVGMHRAYMVPSLAALAGAVALAMLPEMAGTIGIVSVLAILTAGIGSVVYVIRQRAS